MPGIIKPSRGDQQRSLPVECQLSLLTGLFPAPDELFGPEWPTGDRQIVVKPVPIGVLLGLSLLRRFKNLIDRLSNPYQNLINTLMDSA